jgi:hypothetical protein
LLQQTYQLSQNSSVSLLLFVPLIPLTEDKEYHEYKCFMILSAIAYLA